MQLELGNNACAWYDERMGKMVPHDLGAPTVTYVSIPDHQDFDPDIDIFAFRQHLYESMFQNGGVTNFGPGAQALLTVVHPDGTWLKHSTDFKPSWVRCVDNPAFAEKVAEFYGIPVGAPVEVELTHWTKFGPPGTGEGPIPQAVQDVKNIQALLVNTGRDDWANGQGATTNPPNQQTATASSSVSITGTGTPFVASAYIRMICVDNTTGVWGNIESNTTGAITVDRWYNPNTPAGAAGTTPGATDKFSIVNARTPWMFVAVSTTNAASVATDTTMAGEITTAGGGFLRTQATYAHSAGANTYTMANTFTANGSDTGSLPYVVYRMGLFKSMVGASVLSMGFETLLNASATITVSGDSLTCTDTITGS
jgi:hypothetical protein